MIEPFPTKMRFHYASFGEPPDYDPATAIGCDGMPPARVSLSHWPGNSTPPDLVRDLSTGIALAFARLGAEIQRERFGTLETVANDHFDTDGLLAIFCCLEPEEALRREELLLAAAAAGDFWKYPTRRAAQFDMAVSAIAEPGRSRLGDELSKLPAAERDRRALEFLLDRLPQALDDPSILPVDVREEWMQCEADLADLRSRDTAVSRIPSLDLIILETHRAHDPRALFEVAATDRVLEIRHVRGEEFVELHISTQSWFDGPSQRHLKRPDLGALAARWNETATGDGRWIATPNDAPFASLAYGRRLSSGVRDRNVELMPLQSSAASARKTIIEHLEKALP
jgi:hypothetical protein